MPYKIIRQDITKMQVDAIVNSADPQNRVGGGVDGRIHNIGGEKLVRERLSLGTIPLTEAKYTQGYDLPSNYVIHTVGPYYDKNKRIQCEDELRTTYRNCLLMARELECETLAFPLISTGVFNFPRRKALLIAQEEILRFISENEMKIYIVVYDRESFAISQEFRQDISQYISTKTDKGLRDYYSSVEFYRRRIGRISKRSMNMSFADDEGISNRISNVDEGFSKTLLKLIDDTGEKDSVIYKRANIDRKHFWKIKNDNKYKPKKNTVCAFVIALKLNAEEADDLLMRAGFTLSKALLFDVIIQYVIEYEIYDIYEVNNILFDYDQETLGMS